jgi:NAD(P)-dependent dehydrogenase (short-subunit alcohol dehydrogenase family)
MADPDGGRGVNQQELAGKVAVVTGGAGGIGHATAKMLVEAGAEVVIGDIDAEAGTAVAAELGAAVAFKETDVSDVDQVQALVDHAVDRFGGLHVMFNNAGIGSPLKGFLSDDLDDFSSILGVNLFGVIVGTQRAARHMKEHGGGVIINNASIAAVNAGVGMISYRASKAAVLHATRCMAIDLAPYDIRVNCLTPAHIRTGITTYDMAPVLKYMQPLPRHAQPEDVANAVVFLSSDRAAQITGIVLPIDGGTTAGTPYAQTKLIMSQLSAEDPEGEATSRAPLAPPRGWRASSSAITSSERSTSNSLPFARSSASSSSSSVRFSAVRPTRW